MTLTSAILQFLSAAAVVVVAGKALVRFADAIAAPFVAKSAGRIAELSGLGNTFVDTTLVAFSTSLPEWVATLAAVRMKAFDLSLIYHVR